MSGGLSLVWGLPNIVGTVTRQEGGSSKACRTRGGPLDSSNTVTRQRPLHTSLRGPASKPTGLGPSNVRLPYCASFEGGVGVSGV